MYSLTVIAITVLHKIKLQAQLLFNQLMQISLYRFLNPSVLVYRGISQFISTVAEFILYFFCRSLLNYMTLTGNNYL